MFILDRSREVVGFSRWPWDSLYEPLIGCFHDGRLVARAVCNQGYQPVGLDGPLERWWFRMAVPPQVHALLEQGHPSVVILRLEDAAPVAPARPVPFERTRAVRVEEFLSATSSDRYGDLNGFSSFLKAPLNHQLDVLYMDVLGRGIDPPSRVALTERLNRGESILSIRSDLFLSDELMERDVRPSTRVGSLTTSGLRTFLRDGEPLGARWRTLPTSALSSYAERPTGTFIKQFFELCLGRSAEPGTHERLCELADEHGRRFAASIILRDAASTGGFLDLTD